MTIKRLIGTAPSQIPRNKDLGNLAFQNKEAPRFDTLTIDGAVGIGTNTPSYALDVFPVSGSANSIIRAYGPSIARLSLQNSTRHYSMSVQGSSLLVYDETGGATRMTLSSTGELSIANGVTPQFYNEQTLSYPTIRPTLNLDFAGSESVDSRLNFTRASNATYYGADGKIKYAAQNEPRIEYDPVTGECRGLLVEGGSTNLMRGSDHIHWTGYHGYVACAVFQGAALAPDNTYTATLVLETAATDKHCIQTGITPTSSGYHTLSIYVKPNGRTKITFREEYSFGGDIDFDLSTKTVSAGSGVWISNSGKIVDVGDGWYRLSAVANFSSASYCVFDVICNSGSSTSYSGDPTKGFYAWGYQLENSLHPSSYIQTQTLFTSRSTSATYFDSTGVCRIAGYNQARYNYVYDTATAKWISQGLFVEPAATNLLTYSEDFGNTWAGYNLASYLPNSTTAPDGNSTADKIVASTALVGHGTAIAFATSSGVYTASVYVKSAGYNIYLTFGDGSYLGAKFDLTAVTAVGNGNPGLIYSTIQPVGNGWYRCIITATLSSHNKLYIEISNSANSNSFAGDGSSGVYVWGAQVEAGYNASSYIPTFGATVTRATDVVSSTSTSRAYELAQMILPPNIINNSASSLYVNYTTPNKNASSIQRVAILDAVGNVSGLSFYQYGTMTRHEIYYAISGNGTLAGQTIDASEYKAALSSDLTGYGVYVNGIQSTTAMVSAHPRYPITRLTVGALAASNQSLNGYIKKLVYYPARLTNTQLQALTTV